LDPTYFREFIQKFSLFLDQHRIHHSKSNIKHFLNKKKRKKKKEGHCATLAARWDPAQVGPRVLSRADRALLLPSHRH
jgi:hypothetical protein